MKIIEWLIGHPANAVAWSCIIGLVFASVTLWFRVNYFKPPRLTEVAQVWDIFNDVGGDQMADELYDDSLNKMRFYRIRPSEFGCSGMTEFHRAACHCLDRSIQTVTSEFQANLRLLKEESPAAFKLRERYTAHVFELEKRLKALREKAPK